MVLARVSWVSYGKGNLLADAYMIRSRESVSESSLDVSPLPGFMCLHFKCIESSPGYWYEELLQILTLPAAFYACCLLLCCLHSPCSCLFICSSSCFLVFRWSFVDCSKTCLRLFWPELVVLDLFVRLNGEL